MNWAKCSFSDFFPVLTVSKSFSPFHQKTGWFYVLRVTETTCPGHPYYSLVMHYADLLSPDRGRGNLIVVQCEKSVFLNVVVPYIKLSNKECSAVLVNRTLLFDGLQYKYNSLGIGLITSEEE